MHRMQHNRVGIDDVILCQKLQMLQGERTLPQVDANLTKLQSGSRRARSAAEVKHMWSYIS